MLEWSLYVVGFLFVVMVCLGLILIILGMLMVIYETISDWFTL